MGFDLARERIQKDLFASMAMSPKEKSEDLGSKVRMQFCERSESAQPEDLHRRPGVMASANQSQIFWVITSASGNRLYIMIDF
jgi:hypothetical protein